MKKLLLILLLFFPVHSAWAERITLECPEGKYVAIYHIDIDSGQLIYKNDTVGVNLKIYENIFEFDIEPELLRLTQGAFKIGLIDRKTFINRTTGEKWFVETFAPGSRGAKTWGLKRKDCCSVCKEFKF